MFHQAISLNHRAENCWVLCPHYRGLGCKLCNLTLSNFFAGERLALKDGVSRGFDDSPFQWQLSQVGGALDLWLQLRLDILVKLFGRILNVHPLNLHVAKVKLFGKTLLRIWPQCVLEYAIDELLVLLLLESIWVGEHLFLIEYYLIWNKRGLTSMLLREDGLFL